MESRRIILDTINEIAKALGKLSSKVVFVGGSITSLYADDPAAEEIRPTEDIDLVLQISGTLEWVQMQDSLLELGFSPDPRGTNICRFLYKDIPVDIMSPEDSHLGPTNKWYKPGFQYLEEVILNNVKIRILSSAYFLATKFEAFKSRGYDYRTSHDFEDIIYIIDNRINIVEDIIKSDEKVQGFLKKEFKKILVNPYVEEIIISQLNPFNSKERYIIVLEKIKRIVQK